MAEEIVEYTPDSREVLSPEDAAQARKFNARLNESRGGRGKYDDIPDAEIIDPHKNMDKDTRANLDEYLNCIREWRSGDPEFIHDANRVDANLARRKELMVNLASESVLDHHELSSIRPYVHADKVAITNPDPGEEAYENMRLQRDKIRRSLNLETLRVSADEYADVTTKIQGTIGAEKNIEYQRDLISIRKEVAQENAHNPRFVAEISQNEGQLFDELLVDLDRKDLRGEESQQNQAWQESARIRGQIFTEELSKRDSMTGTNANTAQKTQAFMRMVEMGKQVSPNPMAVAAFAQEQVEDVAEQKRAEYRAMGMTEETIEAMGPQGQLGGKNYELGIAAMENKRFSKEMMIDFFESIDHGHYLDSNDQHLMNKRPNKIAQDPVALFRVANAAFNKQFDEGSVNAGISYAAMEYASQQIMNDPEKMGELAKIDIDAAQAVDQFNPLIKEQIALSVGEKHFEQEIHKRMDEGGHLISAAPKILEGETVQEIDGKREKVNIGEILNPQNAQFQAWGDGEGGVILAASEEAKAAGETFHIGPQTITTRDENGEAVNTQAYLSTKGDKSQIDPIQVKFDEDGNISIPNGEEGEQLKVNAENITAQGTAKSLKESVKNEGPHIEILDGGYFNVSATQADAEAGRSVMMSLAGVNIPRSGVATKDDSLDAGDEAKAHLEGLFQQYGERGIKMETIDGRDGQKEMVMRFPNGENVAHRMIRDGYALPSNCEHQQYIREDLARGADIGDKGLWAHGFPEDDGTWRNESLMPHLSRKDKRDRFAKTVGKSVAASPLRAKLIFSDRGSQLFGMKIGQDWESPHFMREAMAAAQSNPDRLMKLYKNNVQLMNDIKKRMEKEGGPPVTEKEKRAHDQLTIGSRLMGRALVNVGERIDPKTGKPTWKYVSPMQVNKDTSELLSRRGVKVPDNMKKFFQDATDKTMETVSKAADGTHSLAKKTLGVAADLVQ